MTRLNLGCGYNHTKDLDVINVDFDPSCRPDQLVDLEQFPWPWEDNSVDGILMFHSLEHLGADYKTFFKIMRELYRILVPWGFLQIHVPDPRSDSFIASPTHVRVIVEETVKLFSQALNKISIDDGMANETLGMQLGIDFDMHYYNFVLLEPWKSKWENKEITEPDLKRAMKSYNNVVDELQFILKKVYPPGRDLEQRISYGTYSED